jgi:hypothetical protein
MAGNTSGRAGSSGDAQMTDMDAETDVTGEGTNLGADVTEKGTDVTGEGTNLEADVTEMGTDALETVEEDVFDGLPVEARVPGRPAEDLPSCTHSGYITRRQGFTGVFLYHMGTGELLKLADPPNWNLLFSAIPNDVAERQAAYLSHDLADGSSTVVWAKSLLARSLHAGNDNRYAIKDGDAMVWQLDKLEEVKVRGFKRTVQVEPHPGRTSEALAHIFELQRAEGGYHIFWEVRFIHKLVTGDGPWRDWIKDNFDTW